MVSGSATAALDESDTGVIPIINLADVIRAQFRLSVIVGKTVRYYIVRPIRTPSTFSNQIKLLTTRFCRPTPKNRHNLPA